MPIKRHLSSRPCALRLATFGTEQAFGSGPCKPKNTSSMSFGISTCWWTSEPFLNLMPRQAKDEPDYLKELLAQAGIDAQASSMAAKLRRSSSVNFIIG